MVPALYAYTTPGESIILLCLVLSFPHYYPFSSLSTVRFSALNPHVFHFKPRITFTFSVSIIIIPGIFTQKRLCFNSFNVYVFSDLINVVTVCYSVYGFQASSISADISIFATQSSPTLVYSKK